MKFKKSKKKIKIKSKKIKAKKIANLIKYSLITNLFYYKPNFKNQFKLNSSKNVRKSNKKKIYKLQKTKFHELKKILIFPHLTKYFNLNKLNKLNKNSEYLSNLQFLEKEGIDDILEIVEFQNKFKSKYDKLKSKKLLNFINKFLLNNKIFNLKNGLGKFNINHIKNYLLTNNIKNLPKNKKIIKLKKTTKTKNYQFNSNFKRKNKKITIIFYLFTFLFKLFTKLKKTYQHKILSKKFLFDLKFIKKNYTFLYKLISFYKLNKPYILQKTFKSHHITIPFDFNIYKINFFKIYSNFKNNLKIQVKNKSKLIIKKFKYKFIKYYNQFIHYNYGTNVNKNSNYDYLRFRKNSRWYNIKTRKWISLRTFRIMNFITKCCFMKYFKRKNGIFNNFLRETTPDCFLFNSEHVLLPIKKKI